MSINRAALSKVRKNFKQSPKSRFVVQFLPVLKMTQGHATWCKVALIGKWQLKFLLIWKVHLFLKITLNHLRTNFQPSFKCPRGGERKTSKLSLLFSLPKIKLSSRRRLVILKLRLKMIRIWGEQFSVLVKWVVDSPPLKKNAFCWPPKEMPKNTQFLWLETNCTFTPTSKAKSSSKCSVCWVAS